MSFSPFDSAVIYFDNFADVIVRRLITLIVLLASCGSVVVFGESNINDFMEQKWKESIEFNKSVTDAEILNFLKFKYEIDPEQLQEIQLLEAEPAKLEVFLENYRSSHDEAGMELPTLRGVPVEELEQLRQLFKYKKKEHDDMMSADSVVNSLTPEQKRMVTVEGKKLINRYPVLAQGSSEHVVKIDSDFPDSLDFLNLKFIYLGETDCRFFIQKGIGRGVGLAVTRNDDEFKLWSFNEYQSWDKTEIEVQ
ncbi:MAG: hypothetical protein AB8G18_02785 [Gammaproteobacteria bacterium]